MLNLRLAQPDLLVDITGIPELMRVEERRTPVADRRLRHALRTSRTAACPIPPAALLPRVARGIAYRAVRNRGTIGGSLAHADPAADWTPRVWPRSAPK